MDDVVSESTVFAVIFKDLYIDVGTTHREILMKFPNFSFDIHTFCVCN